ncbi:MAG: aminotransferase class I/II-fold pyridoxal phosphate-dependent enzyme [Erysipelotrichaceae bacterium]|nr:aminotransferase class I/II-fold pyridoxal phosphate-dependent enzyme [Erysipelotrichaceae bacterium]
MRLPEFKVEQWMTKYEGRAVYNMTDTCVQAITFAELAGDMDPGGIVLDYGTITGDEQTKTEIAKLYQNKDLDTITTAHGCLEANELVIYTLLEPGDHVIVFVPGYQQFSQLPASIGCSVSEIRCEEDKGWLPDLQTVERAVTPQTKMILLNNPNNPTGALWQGQRLRELIDLCRAHDLYLFSDEVYRDIEDQPSISDLYEKGISTASLSKSFGLAGLRYGWVKADKDIIDQINVRRDYAFVSNGPLADALAQSALKEKEKWIRRGKDLVAAI